jgi:heterotetrameric sarcosine oxidase gamma subunit
VTELCATDGFAALDLPLVLDGCTLHALPATPITAIAPYPGQTAALRAHLGAFPDPGQVLSIGAKRLVWAGRDMAFAFSADLPDGLGAFAAVTDQSDGWCGLGVQGDGALAMLARRLPVDLRALPSPGAARSVLEHAPVLVVRLNPHTFEIWGWRSMAQSVLHRLTPFHQPATAPS